MSTNNNYTTPRPTNPHIGEMFVNYLGETEIWDGSYWHVQHPVSSTLGGVAVGAGISLASPTFTGTQMATTQWVQNAMSGQVTLNHSDGVKKIAIDDLVDFVHTMKKRMCILEPALDKHELYPALKEAYENYLLIERLCCGDDPKGE